jgi:hypothetical protein
MSAIRLRIRSETSHSPPHRKTRPWRWVVACCALLQTFAATASCTSASSPASPDAGANAIDATVDTWVGPDASADAGAPADGDAASDGGWTTIQGCPSSSSVAPGTGPTTAVEGLNPTPASVYAHGLGFNVHPAHEWEFALAKDAGATEVRFGVSWDMVALDDAGAPFALDRGDAGASETALGYCTKYGLEPLVVAAYGPPRTELPAPLTFSSLAQNGTCIGVNEAIPAAVTSNFAVGTWYIGRKETTGYNGLITADGTSAYYGALITALGCNGELGPPHSVRVSSPVTLTLLANDILGITRIAFPSVTTESPSDPSLVAFATYAEVLANRIGAHGLTGRVEIWNEPPWAHDPWDCRARFFGSQDAGVACESPNFGMAATLFGSNPPAGVRYVWSGTQKSGFHSLLGQRYQVAMGGGPTQSQASVFASETLHPYGASPEWAAWLPACIATATDRDWARCYLAGTPGPTDNEPSLKLAVVLANEHQADAGWSLPHDISETGIFLGSTDADNLAKARFAARTYLTYLSLGLARVNFYRLWDAPAVNGTSRGTSYSFTDPGWNADAGGAAQPQAAFTAIAGLVADTMRLETTPASAPLAPMVASYQGTYPLMYVPIYGTSSGNSNPSVLFVSWQRSYPVPPDGGTPSTLKQSDWVSSTASPPAGYRVTGARNVTTRECVPVAQDSAGYVVFNVTADPVEVELDPR